VEEERERVKISNPGFFSSSEQAGTEYKVGTFLGTHEIKVGWTTKRSEKGVMAEVAEWNSLI
jgi:hypothetical protein